MMELGAPVKGREGAESSGNKEKTPRWSSTPVQINNDGHEAMMCRSRCKNYKQERQSTVIDNRKVPQEASSGRLQE
jgi:hypothetical protein